MLTRSLMNPDPSRPLLAYTPMLHARLFRDALKYRDHYFQPTKTGLAALPSAEPGDKSGDAYMDGNPAIDRPLIVQFCANDPNELLEAARYVQPYCDAVDLNLGCPQGIAKKGHYGAFLQEDWDVIYRLINTLHENLDIPVTAKIRILETKEKTLRYAQMILSAGASILTVHGRNRDQKGHKTGLADWSAIRYLREHLPPDTVLFANGNILQHEDIEQCLVKTGADGVMSAEGNLCDPTIFAKPPPIGEEGREYWRGRDGAGGYRMDAIFRRYMDIIYTNVLDTSPPARQPLFLPTDPSPAAAYEQPAAAAAPDDEPPSKRQKRNDDGTKTTSPNLLSMQAHLFHLLRPLVSQRTNVRDALARSRAGDMAALENVLRLTEEATRDGLFEYEAHPERYDHARGHDGVALGEERSGVGVVDVVAVAEESSVATVAACWRPWWVCQAYVRPLPREALEKGSLTLSKRERSKLEGEGEGKGKGEGGG